MGQTDRRRLEQITSRNPIDIDPIPPYAPLTGTINSFQVGSNGQTRHVVQWTLVWSTTHYLTNFDYFAHDLFMLNEDGTWLDRKSAEIDGPTTTLPLTKIYRRWELSKADRVGWATYRPGNIKARTPYTVTIISNEGKDPQDETLVQENFGLRIPPSCTGPCFWQKLNTCRINEGDTDFVLRNNQGPRPIWRMLSIRFDCRGFVHLVYLPLIKSQR